MTYDPERHHRRSIRLSGFDYTQAGAYFITICVHDRAPLFGGVVQGAMELNDAGQAVHAVWNALPDHYRHVALDAVIVMPNHFHGIVMIREESTDGLTGSTSDRSGPDCVGAGFKPAPALQPARAGRHGLSEIVRGFKTFSARRINHMRATPGAPVWQRNYYEHVVRDDEERDRIREYIALNPLRWSSDRENPMAASASARRERWEV